MVEERKRVLFVDDASMLLDALKRAMRTERARLDMEFALGPEAALEQLSRGHFDVVVSDLEMPGMKGTELLSLLKQRSPDTARVIMSGQLDSEVFVRASKVMHRYLPKPFEVKELRATINQLCAHQDELSDERLRALLASADLPAAPAVYQELTLAAADSSSSLADLAKIVVRDPAISAKLLQLANAAWFRGSDPALTVENAIMRLGVEMTRSLCLTAFLFDLERDDSTLPEALRTQTLLEGAVATARLARTLAPAGQADVAFTAGLLRQLGTLVLAPHRTAALRAARSEEPREGETFADLERRHIGAPLSQVSAYLLGLWGLPSAIVEAVHGHRTVPRVAPLDAAGAVWAASCLIDEALGARPSLDYEALANLGLLGDLPRWVSVALALAGVL